MFVEERISEIARYIQTNGRATIEELSKKFKVSEVTIRRDLKLIERNYNIKRTHGGAIAYISEFTEFSFDEKYQHNVELKKRIALKAIKYIKDSDTVFLDGGSTNYHICLLLKEFKDLKIVTNSIPILSILRKYPFEVLVLGGSLRKKSFTIVGPIANELLKSFNINIAFIGSTAIDEDGNFFSPSELEAFTKKEIIKNANFSVIVADSSKIKVKSFAKFANLSDVDLFITDFYIDKKILKKFKSINKNISLA